MELRSGLSGVDLAQLKNSVISHLNSSGSRRLRFPRPDQLAVQRIPGETLGQKLLHLGKSSFCTRYSDWLSIVCISSRHMARHSFIHVVSLFMDSVM